MRRSARDVLTRARILSLVSKLEEGFPASQLVGEIARFRLEGALTREEVGLLRDAIEPPLHVAWQIEALQALAWSLGLVGELGPRKPEVYEPTREQLMNESADAALAPRSDEELDRMVGEIDSPAVRVALKWATDDTMAWPSG